MIFRLQTDSSRAFVRTDRVCDGLKGGGREHTRCALVRLGMHFAVIEK